MSINLQTLLNKPGRNRGLFILSALLLALLILLAATFAHINRQTERDTQYLNRAGELRVLSQRIAREAEATVNGGSENSLEQTRNTFERMLTQLRSGDPATKLPASPAAVDVPLTAVENSWEAMRDDTSLILGKVEVVNTLSEFVEVISRVTPGLSSASEEVVQLLIRNVTATPEEVYLASRQVILSQRIASNVNTMAYSMGTAVEPGQGPGAASQAAVAEAADQFRRDVAMFVQVLEGMREGDVALRISRAGDPAIRSKLQEIAELFDTVTQSDPQALERFPDLLAVQQAARNISQGSDKLLTGTTALEQAYGKLAGERLVSPTLGYLLGALALLVLIGIGYKLRRDALKRLTTSDEQNNNNQEAILRLLNELENLAGGDLTARASVTVDITGAIADAVNFTVDSLRSLVMQINQTAVEVSAAAQGTQATAIQLAQASDQQSQQIGRVGTAINAMAISIEQVSFHAAESAGVAQSSVSIAGKGVGAVQNTIKGMDIIREQIQETSKRIKRLAESSQEIGNIVELINDIADQTNILALNAAIQAAMAGDAGRGFAVVADEVQRLAERSGSATKKIETLVRTIQTDTYEAIISMEQSTAGVVSGARLAQDAGGALKEIETVSAKLAALIQGISATAHQQSTAAATISDSMNSIQQITTRTTIGTTKTASSIGKLADLATELRKSVAGFKLPEQAEAA